MTERANYISIRSTSAERIIVITLIDHPKDFGLTEAALVCRSGEEQENKGPPPVGKKKGGKKKVVTHPARKGGRLFSPSLPTYLPTIPRPHLRMGSKKEEEEEGTRKFLFTLLLSPQPSPSAQEAKS